MASRGGPIARKALVDVKDKSSESAVTSKRAVVSGLVKTRAGTGVRVSKPTLGKPNGVTTSTKCSAPLPPLSMNVPLLFAPHAVPLLPPSSLNRSTTSSLLDTSMSVADQENNVNTSNISLDTSISSLSSSMSMSMTTKKEPVSSVKAAIMAASIGRRAKNARRTVATAVKPAVEVTWAMVQERGFKEWLNHILCSSNSSSSSPTSTVTISSVARTLCNDRRMADAFRVATSLYNTDDVRASLTKLDAQIDGGQLGFRTGRNLYDDLRLRATCRDILLQYNHQWLWLGLSVLTGQLLPDEGKDLLDTHFFSTTDLLSPVESSRRLQTTLRKFFHLVYILDRCKLGRIMPGDPCLFIINGTCKSSGEIVRQFSSVALNEGDCVRHLTFLGIHLRVVQQPIDEYDFKVKNLAVDLRDGIRLARLAEVLGEKRSWSVSVLSHMVLPADTHEQKVANMTIALKALSEPSSYAQRALPLLDTTAAEKRAMRKTLSVPVRPLDIVEGSQLKTLSLIWNIILHWDVHATLNDDAIRTEIARIRSFHHHSWPATADMYMASDTLSLLLQWARTVCWAQSAHNPASMIHVNNFTESFNDGRVACLLVSYYHPSLLTRSSIQLADAGDHPQAAPLTPATQRGAEEKVTSRGDKDNVGWSMTMSFTNLTAHEKDSRQQACEHNYQLLHECINQLGDVPPMLRGADMLKRADEKVVITFVTYLYARLVSISREIHACLLLQRVWRRRLIGRAGRILLSRLATERAEALAAAGRTAAEFAAQQQAATDARNAVRAAQLDAEAKTAAIVAERERAEAARVVAEAEATRLAAIVSAEAEVLRQTTLRDEEARRIAEAEAEAIKQREALLAAAAEAERVRHEAEVAAALVEEERVAAQKKADEDAAIAARAAAEAHALALQQAARDAEAKQRAAEHDAAIARAAAKAATIAAEAERQRMVADEQAREVQRREQEARDAMARATAELQQKRDHEAALEAARVGAELQMAQQRDEAERMRIDALHAEAKRIAEMAAAHERQLAHEEALRVEQQRVAAAAASEAARIAKEAADRAAVDAAREAREHAEREAKLERQRAIQDQIRRAAAEAKRLEDEAMVREQALRDEAERHRIIAEQERAARLQAAEEQAAMERAAAMEVARLAKEAADREAAHIAEAERKAAEVAAARAQQRAIIEVALMEATKMAEREEAECRRRVHAHAIEAQTKQAIADDALLAEQAAINVLHQTQATMENAAIALDDARHAATVAAQTYATEMRRLFDAAEWNHAMIVIDTVRVVAELEAKRVADECIRRQRAEEEHERQHQQVMKRFRALLCVQRATRTFLARVHCHRAIARNRQVRHNAAIVLQSAMRQRAARRILTTLRIEAARVRAAEEASIRALQAHILTVLQMRAAESIAARATAARTLQAHWRGMQARRAYSALVFLYRMGQARRHRAAVKVQAAVRMILARRQLRAMIARRRAIECIRRAALRWQRVRIQRRVQSAVELIDDAVTTTLTRWSIVRLCINVRESRAAEARRIAIAAEAKRMEEQRREHGALTLQRYYRGHMGRRVATLRGSRVREVRILAAQLSEMTVRIQALQATCEQYNRMALQATIRAAAASTNVDECEQCYEACTIALMKCETQAHDTKVAYDEYVIYEQEMKRVADEQAERRRMLQQQVIEAQLAFAAIDSERVVFETQNRQLRDAAMTAQSHAQAMTSAHVRCIQHEALAQITMTEARERSLNTREAVALHAELERIAAEELRLAAEAEAERLAEEAAYERELEELEAKEQAARVRAIEEAAAREIAAAELEQQRIRDARANACMMIDCHISRHYTETIRSAVVTWLTVVERAREAVAKKLRQAQSRVQAAIVIQSMWRGRMQRKRRTREMKTVAARLETANQAYQPHMGVGARAAGALDVLLTNRNLHHVTKACTTLETVTRMLPQLCGKVVDQNAVPVLYQLIQSCNRSQPHLVLVQTCLSVLYNLAQNVYTRRSVFAPTNCVDILAELLQIYRDKDRIFLLVTNILNLGCTMAGFASHIRSLREVVTRMHSVRDIMAHKSEAESKLANRRAALTARQVAKGMATASAAVPPASERRSAAAFGPAPPTGGLPACIHALTALLTLVDQAPLPMGMAVPPSPSVTSHTRAVAMTAQLRSVLGSAALAAAAATASNVPTSVQATVAARALETTVAAMNVICQPPAALRTPARKTAGSVATPSTHSIASPAVAPVAAPPAMESSSVSSSSSLLPTMSPERVRSPPSLSYVHNTNNVLVSPMIGRIAGSNAASAQFDQ